MTEKIKLDDLMFENITILDESHREVSFNMREELAINSFDLTEEYRSQPAKYMYWTALHSKVGRMVESKNIEIDRMHAVLYNTVREDLIKAGTPKPTQAQLEASIDNNQHIVRLREELANLNALETKTKYIVKAFEQRKDMLMQLGADNRKQKDYEQAIRNF